MTAADDREVTPAPCGDRAPLYGDGPPLFCDLRSGHAGWHEGGEHRTSWTYHAQPTPDARDALAAAEARGVEHGRTEALKSAARMLLAEAESFGRRAALSDWERGYGRGLERAAHDVANSIARGPLTEVPDA